MTQPQHDDPFGEVRTQAAQVLAVAATVGEAAARWYAVGLQNKAIATERENTADGARRAADRLANQAQENQDHQLINKGLTDWLSHATMEETVRLWRTATIYAAAGDTRAAEAAARAEERLRNLNTPFMDAYQQRRASGMQQADAMRAAAYDMWDAAEAEARAHQPARPHGNDRDTSALRQNGPSLPAGGAALNELDAAVRDEVGRLAAHITPEALDKIQREWREAWMAPAADAAGLLRQLALDAASNNAMPQVAVEDLLATASRADADLRGSGAAARGLEGQADTEERAAEIGGAKPDDPATSNVDEHHQGQDDAAVHTDHANADLSAAAHQQELMRHAFPQLTQIGQMPGHVATKQPANVTAALRRARTR